MESRKKRKYKAAPREIKTEPKESLLEPETLLEENDVKIKEEPQDEIDDEGSQPKRSCSSEQEQICESEQKQPVAPVWLKKIVFPTIIPENMGKSLPGQNLWPCDGCSAVLPLEELRIHKMSGHKNMPINTVCTECGECFMNKAAFAQHLIEHLNERPFTCDICSADFVTVGELLKHKALHTSTKPKFGDLSTLQAYSDGQYILSADSDAAGPSKSTDVNGASADNCYIDSSGPSKSTDVKGASADNYYIDSSNIGSLENTSELQGTIISAEDDS